MPVSLTWVDLLVREHQTQILLVKAWNESLHVLFGKVGYNFFGHVLQKSGMGSSEIFCWVDLTSFSLDSAKVLPLEVEHGQMLPPESASFLGDVSSASGESKRVPKDGKGSGRIT